jgi:uncharacterized membrane protein YqaE (UPF0057 family)
MKYFLALVLPPVAVLITRPGQIILNIILCILGWVPGMIHALIVVGSYEADKRNEKLIKAIRESGR